MTFLDPPPTGDAEIGILYAPAAPMSHAHASQMAGLFGSGVTVGRLTVRARLVDVAALTTVQGLAGIFVPYDLAADAPALAAAARRLHVPIISTDLRCVQQGDCAIGVDSSSGVRIVLSHAACQAAGITFIQAFRILVAEQ